MEREGSHDLQLRVLGGRNASGDAAADGGVGLDTTSILTMPPIGGPRPHASALRSPSRRTILDPDDIEAASRRQDATDPNSPDDLAALAPGTVLEGTRIRILGVLGKGATSVVYRAADLDLQRPLAVKMLRRIPDEATRERFVREARFAARLRSEYVAAATGVGTLSDGRLYYTMRLARGSTIASMLREGPLPPAQVVSALRMACKALAEAHAQGIVHRDIKPANMVLGDHDGRERLLLLDFGIAGPTGRPCDGLWGTPRYMPPEQIRGDRLDARTDIYSLGCCAFEMLTGEPLFDGRSTQDVLLRHLDPRPLAPESATAIPRPLLEVIAQCTSLNPDARPSSAAELEARLCEAQLEAGLTTGADMLEPPQVEPKRRDEIVAGLLALRRRARRAALGWPVLVAMMSAILLSLAHLAAAEV